MPLSLFVTFLPPLRFFYRFPLSTNRSKIGSLCLYMYVCICIYIYIYCLLEDFQGGCAKWVNFWKSVEIRFWGFEERERERVYASELILWHFGRVGWVWIARTGQGRAVTQALATAFGGLSFIRVFLSRASSLLITRYLQ